MAKIYIYYSFYRNFFSIGKNKFINKNLTIYINNNNIFILISIDFYLFIFIFIFILG